MGTYSSRKFIKERIKMLRCPKCHRFGVEYRGNGFWGCLWMDCLHITSNYQEITNAKHPRRRFSKFIKSLKKKQG